MAVKKVKDLKLKLEDLFDFELAAIDIGFNGSKRMSSLGMFGVIPSTVMPTNEKFANSFKHTEVDESRLMVKTTDGFYHVGEQAMKSNKLLVTSRTTNHDRASDPSFRVMFETNLALCVPHEDGEYNVYLTTGLPNEDFDKGIRTRLEEYINQSFEIVIYLGYGKTITKKINVIGYEILRQPEGSVTSTQFAFTKEGLLTTTLYRALTAIVDIGHLTTDYALFSEGVYVEEEGTYGSTLATAELYKRLKVSMAIHFDNEFGVAYSPTDDELDSVVRGEEIEFNGASHNLYHLVEEAAKEISAVIANEVITSWGQHANRVKIILLSGGGAHIFQDFLKEEFAKRKVQAFSVVDDPQMANVYGFYIRAAMNQVKEQEDGSLNFEQVYERFIKDIFESEAA
ncbi:ParM/StbA family protein (plasmid) [Paenibacillus urinalis]|uniref:ParM/StbA family protein n=1 Tax=Paenibacillus urinalis TaxID=521520 RepID=A0ABY7XJW5_9BACL|nr:ParM/StbA family protein [Paenibacillus urinalis]WDI05155.1 ParM/StbA family protein [Paenibacillus urinalis]